MDRLIFVLFENPSIKAENHQATCMQTQVLNEIRLAQTHTAHVWADEMFPENGCCVLG